MGYFSLVLFLLLAVSFGWLYRVSRRLRAAEAKLAATAPVPPAKTLPPPPEPHPGVPPPERVDWLRWESLIGVRGTATVGAVVLAVAGLFVLKYSFEHYPPWVRVVLVAFGGVVCLAISEVLRRRGDRTKAAAVALAGAGMVLLFSAVWIARTVYELIGPGLAFGIIVVGSLACGALSWLHDAQVLAVLGLGGGLAAPGVLTAAPERPLTLFGYLLPLSFVAVEFARRQGWRLLAWLTLGGATLYQAYWIFSRMKADSVLIGLAVLAAFAVLFAVAGRWVALVQAAGVFVPFAFAFYFAGAADLGPYRYVLPLAALLLVLSILTYRIARQQGRPLFGLAAAAATVAAIMVWWVRVSSVAWTVTPSLIWEAVIAGAVLALAFHLFWELDAKWGAGAERLAALGFLVLFVIVPLGLEVTSPWPWICGWTVLAVLLWRQAAPLGGIGGDNSAAYLPAAGAVLAGTGAGAFYLVHGGAAVIVYAVAAAVACRVAASQRRGPGAEIAAAALPLALLVTLVGEAAAPTLEPWAFYVVTLAAAALVAWAATRVPSGGLYFAAMAVLALDHGLWTGSVTSDAALLGFVAQLVAVIAFTAWPFYAGEAFRAQPWTWYGAALAGPAWLGSLLALGAVAVPLELGGQWITLGWALQGLAVIALLWQRRDHVGLKVIGLALLLAAAARLVFNPTVPGHYPVSGWPVVNWLLYTYLVPAAALVLAAQLLARLEVPRLRAWEKPLYGHAWPAAAVACGVAAVAVVFVWINKAIADFFWTGRQLLLSFDRAPARDLTLSLAWAVYALVLLAVAIRWRIRPLRWASLAFLVATLGKVFLYDLRELSDIYRVASLVGLAASLLVAALAYQRFVFGRGPRALESS